MARIVVHTDQGPTPLQKEEMQAAAAYICSCGLSQAGIMCDGSHKMTAHEAPGVIYQYTRGPNGELHRTEVPQ